MKKNQKAKGKTKKQKPEKVKRKNQVNHLNQKNHVSDKWNTDLTDWTYNHLLDLRKSAQSVKSVFYKNIIDKYPINHPAELHKPSAFFYQSFPTIPCESESMLLCHLN